MLQVSCTADGFPIPKIRWQLLVDGSEYRDMNENFSNFIILNNGSFLIENATKKNEGTFLCQVTNGIGGVHFLRLFYSCLHFCVYFSYEKKN